MAVHGPPQTSGRTRGRYHVKSIGIIGLVATGLVPLT